MALNGISTLASKQLRQAAKLALAETKRQTAETNGYRVNNILDIELLPTQYLNTVVLLTSSTESTMLANSSEYGDVVANYTVGPTWSTANPFTPSIGGSMIFGAADSYISIAGRPEFAVGYGDFTVEWWQYQTSLADETYPRVFAISPWPTTSIGVSIENGVFYTWINGDYVTTTIDDPINSWQHFAFVRKDGQVTVYQQGVSKNSFANNEEIVDDSSAMTIGGLETYESTARFPGHITNFRFVSGQALYTDEFTPSTVPFTVSDLLNNPNAGGLVAGRPWTPAP